MGDYNDAFLRNNTTNNAAVQARTKAQNRANVLQLKLIGQSHPTGLTSNLLKLFEPRPPLEFKAPPEKRKCPPYTGIGKFVSTFAEPGDPEYSPPVLKGETPAQRRERIHKVRLERGAEKATEELLKYDPNSDPNCPGDPYKTLFVARLNYETTENRIKREFEAYGPIKRVRLVTDKLTNKPKGYAFIEYVHTRDMKGAYKQADGKKVDGKRVLVDVERGRTVPNWRPRRLGGGLGTTRIGGEDANQHHPGREQPQQQRHAAAPMSEEPRTREERNIEREEEKPREKPREEKREQQQQLNERGRDRDERHHRERGERNRDRESHRGRERGYERDRGRDRGRDYDRSYRDRDRERDRDRDRERPRERDYEAGEVDYERARSREVETAGGYERGRRDRRVDGYEHGYNDQSERLEDGDDDRENGRIPDAEEMDDGKHEAKYGGYEEGRNEERYPPEYGKGGYDRRSYGYEEHDGGGGGGGGDGDGDD